MNVSLDTLEFLLTWQTLPSFVCCPLPRALLVLPHQRQRLWQEFITNCCSSTFDMLYNVCWYFLFILFIFFRQIYIYFYLYFFLSSYLYIFFVCCIFVSLVKRLAYSLCAFTDFALASAAHLMVCRVLSSCWWLLLTMLLLLLLLLCSF